MDLYVSYAPADVLRTKDETFKEVFSGKLIFFQGHTDRRKDKQPDGQSLQILVYIMFFIQVGMKTFKQWPYPLSFQIYLRY